VLLSEGNDLLVLSDGSNYFWERFVNPLISEDKLSIEIHEILDNDFQKIHSKFFELSAKFDHVIQVEEMRVNTAEFMRVVLFETMDDGFLVIRLLEELSKAVQR
jgi:hypothetical protein